MAGAVGGTTVSGGLRSGENAGQPMLDGRLGYHATTKAGGAFQFGVWGHTAQEKFDATGAGEETFDSHSLGIDTRVPLYSDRVWIMGEYFAGENLRDIRGGILQGVNPTTGEEIAGMGGFVELGYQATEHLTLYGGYSRDDPDNADLDPYQRANNSIPYVAARWRYSNFRMGLEYLNWTTDYIDLDDGTANRVAAWIALYF
jgi:hypothetical protein